MLIIRVGGIFEHWELDDYERKLIVAPLLSPKPDKRCEEGVIAVRLMVVRLALIIEEAFYCIRANS